MRHLLIFIFMFIPHAAVGHTNLCLSHIDQAAWRAGVPKELMHAVAQVESGRYNKITRKLEPWPWTVYAEGKGHFFPSKKAAVEYIQSLKKRRIKNYDVGCFQISGRHHGHKFTSLSHMLEPSHNVAYASQLLKNHRKIHNSWLRAIGYYHSATPKHNKAYTKKVYDTWVENQKRSVKEQGKKSRARYKIKRRPATSLASSYRPLSSLDRYRRSRSRKQFLPVKYRVNRKKYSSRHRRCPFHRYGW